MTVLDVATPLHGKPKDELDAEDLRAHRKAIRLAVVGASGLVVTSLGLAMAGYLAMKQRDLAQRRLDIALSGTLAAQARQSADLAPSLANRNLLLAVEAMRRNPTVEAAEALRAGIRLSPLPLGRILHSDAPSVIALSEDGRYVAAAAPDRSGGYSAFVLIVVEVATGKELMRLRTSGEISEIELSSASGRVAIVSGPERINADSKRDPTVVEIWKVATGRMERRIASKGSILSIAWNVDGSRLLTGDASGQASVGMRLAVRLWAR